jgi:hypothetical protein
MKRSDEFEDLWERIKRDGQLRSSKQSGRMLFSLTLQEGYPVKLVQYGVIRQAMK